MIKIVKSKQFEYYSIYDTEADMCIGFIEKALRDKDYKLCTDEGCALDLTELELIIAKLKELNNETMAKGS